MSFWQEFKFAITKSGNPNYRLWLVLNFEIVSCEFHIFRYFSLSFSAYSLWIVTELLSKKNMVLDTPWVQDFQMLL